MKNGIVVTLRASTGLLSTAGIARAQTATDRVYTVDARGEVAKSGFGLSWRTDYWTPAAAANDVAGCACNKDLLPKESCRPAPALDQLDRDIIGKLASCTEVQRVIVTGHTNRLGSQQYNQKLSETRADAVKPYLIPKGAKTDAINPMGTDKTQPVPGLSCNNKLPRKSPIECLAPNRRTVVEVKGPAK